MEESFLGKESWVLPSFIKDGPGWNWVKWDNITSRWKKELSCYWGRVEKTEKEEGTQGGRTGEGQGRIRLHTRLGGQWCPTQHPARGWVRRGSKKRTRPKKPHWLEPEQNHKTQKSPHLVLQLLLYPLTPPMACLLAGEHQPWSKVALQSISV